MSTLIRFGLTIALLVVVWRNSHWSVALCLTLLSIAVEAIDYAARQRFTAIAEMMEILRTEDGFLEWPTKTDPKSL